MGCNNVRILPLGLLISASAFAFVGLFSLSPRSGLKTTTPVAPIVDRLTPNDRAEGRTVTIRSIVFENLVFQE